jgi:hypothetical protein
MKKQYRIYDTVKKEFFKPVNEAYKGNLEQMFMSPNGDLSRRTMNGFEHESVFPGRYLIHWSPGRQDKNGNTIYEEDILKSSINLVYLLKYREDLGSFVLNDVYWNIDLITDGLGTFEDCEVIGNRLMNPELLVRKEVSK